jgi:hypothetical protein
MQPHNPAPGNASLSGVVNLDWPTLGVAPSRIRLGSPVRLRCG